MQMEYQTSSEQRAAEYLNQNLLKVYELVVIFHFKITFVFAQDS